MRILGIDLGQASVGLAFYDEEIGFVLPLDGLIRSNLGKILEEIVKIVKIKKINLVLVGRPEGDYLLNKSAEKVDWFLDKLKEKFELEKIEVKILCEDEGFTSFLAENVVREFGLHLNQEKEKLHSMAAKILIERYLENKS